MKTAAVHAGHPPNPVTGASAPDVVMSTTFIIDPGISFSADEITDETPFVYTRWGNPTVAQLEDKLAVLEGAEDCVAFASGMAAITALFLHCLKSGRPHRHERRDLRGRVGVGQRQTAPARRSR